MAMELPQVQEDQGRRQFLRRAVMVTGGTAVGSTAMAQENPDRYKSGRLPANTPITKLGLNAAEIAMLTAGAKKATKADLFALQNWSNAGSKGNPPAGLTSADVTSIGKAFESEKARQHDAAAMDSCTGTGTANCCCCCCTPCCCCASAVVEPIQ